MVHQEGSCPLCPTSVPTATATALRRHYRLEHKKTITLKEASRVLRGQRGPAPRMFYCRVCGAQFSVKADLKAHEAAAHPGDGHHHCASCGRVFPMSEVKTHACLSPEERRNVSALLHLRARQASGKLPTTTTPTITTTAATTTTTTTQDTPTTTLILPEDTIPGEEEEEEYLVMYITPEGESVSYVMKKGSRPWQEEVLEVDAPGEVLGVEDTIMINVHHQDHDNTLLITQGDAHTHAHTPPPPTPTPTPTPTPSIVDHTPSSPSPIPLPLPLHSIKLEPQGDEDDPVDDLSPPDNTLLPLIIPKTEPQPHTTPKELTMIKTEKTDNNHNEEMDQDDTTTTTTTTTTTKKPGGERKSYVKPQLVCLDCGKTFNKQWNFKQHLATHNASLHRYRCDQCGLTFAYRSTLNKHMDHHNPTPKIHQCQQCPKVCVRVCEYFCSAPITVFLRFPFSPPPIIFLYSLSFSLYLLLHSSPSLHLLLYLPLFSSYLSLPPSPVIFPSTVYLPPSISLHLLFLPLPFLLLLLL